MDSANNDSERIHKNNWLGQIPPSAVEQVVRATDFSRVILRTAVPLAEMIRLSNARMMDAMRPILSGLSEAMIPFYRNMAAALEPVREWLAAHQEAADVLVARGWWVHPHWSSRIMFQVLRLKQDKRLRLLDRMICETYEINRCRPMSQALTRWRTVPEFEERTPIFKDGLWAYRRGKYRLAVSAWLPQVEGVLRGVTTRQDWGEASWPRTLGAINAEDGFIAAFRELFGEPSAERAAFPVRRHSILHGKNVGFGKRGYAMRIFLMLDALHYFIEEFERECERAA